MRQRRPDWGAKHAASDDGAADRDPADNGAADRDPADDGAADGDTAVAHVVPTSPIRLHWHDWRGVLRRAVREYREDGLGDWAAALTYRAMLSLFPGLLVLLSTIGLLGSSASTKLLDNLEKYAPGTVRPTLKTIFTNAQNQHATAGVIGVISLLVALWSASGYVAAFMRASNSIYDVNEGRPIWKTVPIRIGVTLFLVVTVLVSVAIAVMSRGIATDIGNLVGLGRTAVDVWGVVKWPLLLVIAALTLALLYWAAPNARQAGFSWITPGGFVTVVVWASASAGFAVYVANFSSYENTYGSLAGIFIFLIWLWISNIALLLGAEFNAELERARAIGAGVPENEEPYVLPRDVRKLDATDRERVEALSRQLGRH